MHSQFRFPILYAVLAGMIFLTGCSSTQESVSSYDKQRESELSSVKAGKFDSGRMWTFEYPPVEYFEQTYDFKADKEWLDDVRLSSLRFATYCSASFVSADGLVMTNHHCARQSVEQVSKEGEKLIETGFWASILEDEREVPGLFVDQLVEIRDVSDEIVKAMDMFTTDENQINARDSVIGVVEERVSEETGHRADVVSLYNGGRYSVYVYKRYSDIRLVFAPELLLGFFGGDYDNFTYPRYSFDCSFFRVYDEEGNPLKTNNYFQWSKNGVRGGEAVFVIGNPGRTSRLNTSEQLAFNRDFQYPYIAGILNDRVDVLKKFADKNPDKKEEMLNQVFSIANSQKAYNGQLAGLRDDVLMQRRKDFDRTFRAKVESKPELKAKYGHLWDEIATARSEMRKVAPDLYALRTGGIGTSAYLRRAIGLVRYANEMDKPDTLRGRAYQENRLKLTKRSLSRLPDVDSFMEELTFAKQLASMQRWLGHNDPIVKLALDGQTSEQAAKRLLAKTVFGDSSKLAAIVADSSVSIGKSDDRLIAIARLIIPRTEKAREISTEVMSGDEINRTLLGRALFDVYGTSIPPDATFTLRLADGVVSGYEYNGTMAPPYTTFYGMYDRHNSFAGEESWDLPDKWKNPPPEFDLSTPVNFVSTNDIIGGNSGSPMINLKKEIVGLIFDGNIESLPGDYIFAEDANNRTVSVHSAGIVEAIRHIYGASRLADELESGAIR